MTRFGTPSREPRRSLSELEPELRGRLRSLDEPVARDDWADVIRRSRAFSAGRARLILAVAASIIAAATTGSLVALGVIGGGGSKGGQAPARLAFRMSDGSGLVLYSTAARQQFLDNADGRVRGITTGPFGYVKAMVKDADGPAPGDEALFSYNLYRNASLEQEAGSATLTCQYGFDRSALCDAFFQLNDGGGLSASGVLNFEASRFTLVVTGGDGRYFHTRGVLEQMPTPRLSS